MSIQPANPDEFPGVSLDMQAIAREALMSGASFTGFKLTFENHGQEYYWEGSAQSRKLAELHALAALSSQYPTFNRYKARLIACIEG